MTSTDGTPTQELNLVIKSPSNTNDGNIELTVPGTMLLHELKEALRHKFPGNPSQERITVIHAGKVLKSDTAPLSSFLTPVPDSPQFVLHVVIKPLAHPLTAASSPSAWSPTRPTVSPTPPATSEAGPSNTSAAATPTPPAPAPVPVDDAPTSPPVVSTSTDSDRDPETVPPIREADPATEDPVVEPPPPPFTPTGYPSVVMPGTPPFIGMPASPASYQAMFTAAYAAALQAIVAANPDAANASPSTLQQPPAVAFIPTILPHMHQQQQHPGYMMPTPPIPGGVNNPQQQLRNRGRRNITAHVPPAELAAALRAARDAQGHLPPALDDLLNAMDAAERARNNRGAAGQQQQQPAAANNNNQQERNGRAVQFRIRINARVVLQTMVLMVVLYQHCSMERFVTLMFVGFALYLTTIERVRQFMLGLAGVRLPGQNQPAPPRQAPAAAAGAAAGEGQQQEGDAAAQEQQPDNDNAEPAVPQPPPNTFQIVVREVKTFVVGFITSLLPGWNMNPEDRAALAAAQEAAAREQEQIRQGPLL